MPTLELISLLTVTNGTRLASSFKGVILSGWGGCDVERGTGGIKARVRYFSQTVLHSTSQWELLGKVAGERPILILIQKFCWDRRNI